MNTQKQKVLAQSLTQVAKHAQASIEQNDLRTAQIVAEGITFWLQGESVDEYEKIVETLLTNSTWSAKFSESYIDGHIRVLLATLVKEQSGARAPSLLASLVTELDTYDEEHVVYVPVVNVLMQDDTLLIGNVVLHKTTDAAIEDMAHKVEAILAANLDTTPEEKVATMQTVRQMTFDPLKGAVLAEYTTIAEPNRAKERAVEETRRVLDLFYYAIPVLYPDAWNVTIGLMGDVFPSQRVTPVFSKHNDSFSLQLERTGPLVALHLNPEHIQRMTAIGVFTMSAVLQKPDPTDFEMVLLRAIHWIANAHQQIEKENELLNLMTCLEAFLTPRDGSPIRTAIADGVAIILGSNLESRKAIKKSLLAIYGKRSRTSHGGKEAVLAADIAYLRTVALHLTATMIKRKDEFPLQQALFDWIEDQRLG